MQRGGTHARAGRGQRPPGIRDERREVASRRIAETPELPDVVSRYQQAHDRRDTDAALATFSEDAHVADDGKEYRGSDEIRGWLDTAAAEFTFTRTLVSTALTGDDTWLVVNHLAGDFPGSPVDLRYRFVLEDGRITELEIAP